MSPDRENHRVQVFDGNGKYETQWNNWHCPCGLYMPYGITRAASIGEPLVNRLNANLGPRVSIVDNQGKLLSRIGDPFAGTAATSIGPHGLTVDSRGDLYVGEVCWTVTAGAVPGPAASADLRAIEKYEPAHRIPRHPSLNPGSDPAIDAFGALEAGDAHAPANRRTGDKLFGLEEKKWQLLLARATISIALSRIGEDCLTVVIQGSRLGRSRKTTTSTSSIGGDHPMMVFDREGNFLRSWGEGQYRALTESRWGWDDSIHLTDDGGHFVRKCSLDGKVLLELGASRRLRAVYERRAVPSLHSYRAVAERRRSTSPMVTATPRSTNIRPTANC